MANTMKRIITLILASIISFNLSACGKTKQLIQSNISTQQSGPDTTDYKKLYENECRVSKWKNYTILGLGLLSFAAVLCCIDKVAYSRFMETSYKAEVSLCNLNLNWNLKTNEIIAKDKKTLADIHSFWAVASSKDKPAIKNKYDSSLRYMLESPKLFDDGIANVKGFSQRMNFTESALGKYMPYKSLRTVGWNWIKSKFVGRKK
jgi:hypothetical protein